MASQVVLYTRIISFKKISGAWSLFAYISKQISEVIVIEEFGNSQCNREHFGGGYIKS